MTTQKFSTRASDSGGVIQHDQQSVRGRNDEHDEDEDDEDDEDDNDEEDDDDEEEYENIDEYDDDDDFKPEEVDEKDLHPITEPIDETARAELVDTMKTAADRELHSFEDVEGNEYRDLPDTVELNPEVARRYQRLIDANEAEFAESVRAEYFVIDALADVQSKVSNRPGPVSLEPEDVDAEERQLVQERLKELGLDQTCRLCEAHAPLLEPLNVGLLVRYLSAYGTIKSRKHTALCAKHQRKLNKVVRRARHMGILSNKNKTFTVYSPFEDLIIERTDDGDWQVRMPPVEGQPPRKHGMTSWQEPFPDEEVDHEKTAAAKRDHANKAAERARNNDKRVFPTTTTARPWFTSAQFGTTPVAAAAKSTNVVAAADTIEKEEVGGEEEDEEAIKAANAASSDEIVYEQPEVDPELLELEMEREQMQQAEMEIDVEQDYDDDGKHRRRK